MKINRALVGIGIVGSMLTSCATQKSPATPEPDPEQTKTVIVSPIPKKPEPVSFTRSIKPILSNKCTICHNAEVMANRPWFETRESALKSGMIVPGKPDQSRMLTVIEVDPEELEQAMPPVSHRLTEQEISLLRTWIDEGANWPGGKAGRVKPAFIPQE